MTATTTQAKAEKFGLSVALATPFTAHQGIDFERMVNHAEWCLGHGCDSVTLFGTTGEGASIGIAGRHQMLGAMAGHGIAPGQVVAGVAAASVHETVEQARLALDFGCKALLLAPPFYFKGVSDDGLFAWFARVFEALGPGARDMILYHIPSVTAVDISPALIARLRAAFPGVVTGIKDSSGNAANTRRCLNSTATSPSSSATSGNSPRRCATARRARSAAWRTSRRRCCALIAHEGRDDDRVNQIVDLLVALPVVPAVKALVAHRLGDPDWLHYARAADGVARS